MKTLTNNLFAKVIFFTNVIKEYNNFSQKATVFISFTKT